MAEETPPPAKKVSLSKNLANMISTLANHKTRSIEVSRGHNEETQAVIFPPHTRNEVKIRFLTKLVAVDGSMLSPQNRTTIEACSCISQNIGVPTLMPSPAKSET
jgi:hypothetical protein